LPEFGQSPAKPLKGPTSSARDILISEAVRAYRMARAAGIEARLEG